MPPQLPNRAVLSAVCRNRRDDASRPRYRPRRAGPSRQDASTAEEEADLGFLAGLGGGWTAFLASARVLLTVLDAVLPFAVVIGVPLWLLLLRRRRVRARRTPPAGPSPAVPTPPGPPGGPVSAPPPVPAARSGP
ncbi:DUF4349 domain-containing protein [Micromonospora sp. CNB394]|uniref:DUF4349 domain-containing protein n=1 Tax=Micromonospora sp. CNB394 TaxID=1169151 RepID=UPI0003A00227|nr:DUF4349 domain-containing protein [Micromonospora sp. CNB394]